MSKSTEEIEALATPTASGPCTVSTLKEAEQFAAGGVRNILYAVGIAPSKLSRVVEPVRRLHQFEFYHVLDEAGRVGAIWPRFSGW